MTASSSLVLTALTGIPEVQPGDDLPLIIGDAIVRAVHAPRAGDVIVLAQKIFSKAEHRFVVLDTVKPSARALELAEKTGKDPRIVELILGESHAVLRTRKNVLVVEHRLGMVLASAGIDQSNIGPDRDGRERALLLPLDPDGSCQAMRDRLMKRFGVEIGVIMNDSIGRAWRNGIVGTAIGVAGVPALLDRRGAPDRFGRKLEITMIGVADEIAAAASILMGQADEGTPAVHMRGVPYGRRDSSVRELIRARDEDLFR
ncbi:MAG: coenzyme F420-0:L-glutamate ligase [Betaproteobacteria bacterium]|nr:coenzyme F420-0:L-glutamate ligase [Betaproteobacteria bacterium]